MIKKKRLCPLCGEVALHPVTEPGTYSWAVIKGERTRGHSCSRCGATQVKDKPEAYERRCHACDKVCKELFGLFVPSLCQACENAQAANAIKTGDVCGMCGKPRTRCCC